MSSASRSRIGTHGEVYHAQPSKEQTFTAQSVVKLEDWQTPRDGVRAVVALLRQMASHIERHQDGLYSDPKPPFGDRPYVPPEPITTPLCSLELHGFVEDPPFYDYTEHYRLRMTVRLGFE